MAYQEIEAINPRSCAIEVGYGVTMKEEDVPDAEDALIFRVSRSLPDSDRLYVPRLVSIGPFHYGKEELRAMEKSKNEAVRRMQIRIQKNNAQATIKSFVEGELLSKNKEIRKFYGEFIPFTSIELAWIITRDACFIYEFILNYLRWSFVAGGFYENENEGFSWKYDAVFDVNLQNPMREGLIDDILLFENQIPLWVLKDILQIQMGSPEAAGQKLDNLADMLLLCLTRHQIFIWHLSPSPNRCSHVLEILYHGLLGSYVENYKNGEAFQLVPSPNCIQISFKKSIKALCACWCKLYLRFCSSNTSPGDVQRMLSSCCNCKPLWFKSGVNSMKTICEGWCKMRLSLLSSKMSSNEVPQMDFVKLPTASELTRAGVKIHPVTSKEISQGAAIKWIRFDEITSTLYLPAMKATQQSHSVIGNIIAMEVSTINRYYPRPMTQYILLMDELIDNEEDVAVLRNLEVIQNFMGSNQEVADLFNSLGSGMMPSPGCRVINDARRGLHKYTGRKYKILWSELWSQFKSAYSSKPWLVCGSIATVLLLWMTMAQVLCLFITCNPNSS